MTGYFRITEKLKENLRWVTVVLLANLHQAKMISRKLSGISAMSFCKINKIIQCYILRDVHNLLYAYVSKGSVFCQIFAVYATRKRKSH
ncbi:MAG: hypothetical protein MJ196_01915 [Treponemataceae bacterium]|nr:hypothetical protein [Treponemataceae bacterium]